MMFRIAPRLKFTKQRTPWLTENEMREYIPPNWELNHTSLLGLNLHSQFSFPNPARARLFLSGIHALEDEEKHHAHITLIPSKRYDVSVVLSTHHAIPHVGVTLRDARMAALIEQLFEDKGFSVDGKHIQQILPQHDLDDDVKKALATYNSILAQK